ncbi:MAG: TonB-dependent receptor [Marinagarivorans sp.]|nr:TonB-dependent receptor [Marinagarivorans sp.]
MTRLYFFGLHCSGLIALCASLPTSAFATEASPIEEIEASPVEEIIVTGSVKAVNKLESSISVNSITAENLQSLAPRSIAEAFRSLPGIRSESSGGGGNANITVRGIPLATGGSKYMQIHEDGLPVLEFGDINFANADNFVRLDTTVDRIESVRGGSASTLASNSPGGIINILSKTGQQHEGSLSTALGLDYREFRTEIETGGELNDEYYYYLGGHFRNGEGVRTTGFNGDNGGQLKFNLTKVLENGFLRFNFKNLNDQMTTYLPSPVKYLGGGKFGPLPDYNASTQTLANETTAHLTTFDAFGNPQARAMSDGISTKVTALGFELQQSLQGGITLNNKFRTSDISGGFIAPFTDGFAGGTTTVAAKGQALCEGASINKIAINCTQGVKATIAGATANPNQLAFTNLTFDTSFKDVGLTVNDLKLTKTFDNIEVTAGYYFSQQHINISWDSWAANTQTLSGTRAQNIQYEAINAGINSNGDAVNVLLTNNGALSQSFLAWNWDLEYTSTAPYINLSFTPTEQLSWDASLRFDRVQARGLRLDGCCGGNTSIDLNGNGSIGSYAISNGIFTRLDSDALLENAQATSAGFINGGVRVLNLANSSQQTPVNYNANNLSYSLGGTYLLSDTASVFARYSRGGRAIADRLTQVAGTLNTDGSLTATTDGYDNVNQLEAGYKFIGAQGDFFATYFNTAVDETNADITTTLSFVRAYKAQGIELEGSYELSDQLRLRGNATWTNASITSDKINPAVVGHTPRRQAAVIYTITPEYRTHQLMFGLSLQGSSAYFLGDNNQLKQQAYVITNAYANWNLSPSLALHISINNVTNEFVLTEAEETLAAVGDSIRGRPLSGRSSNLGLRYLF